MKWIDNFDFFLFDFDGLLVNTEAYHFLAYKQVLAARGFDLNWSFLDYCSYAHLGSDYFKEALFAKFSDLEEQLPSWSIFYKEKQEQYFALISSSSIELMPGVGNMLACLQKSNKRSCVVTNSLKEQIDLIKGKVSALKKITYWVTREDYEKAKPAPDGYLKAIELYAKKEDKIIGFEDTLKGLKALCKTPSMAILICPSDHPQIECVLPEKTHHFESFNEMLKLSSL